MLKFKCQRSNFSVISLCYVEPVTCCFLGFWMGDGAELYGHYSLLSHPQGQSSLSFIVLWCDAGLMQLTDTNQLFVLHFSVRTCDGMMCLHKRVQQE